MQASFCIFKDLAKKIEFSKLIWKFERQVLVARTQAPVFVQSLLISSDGCKSIISLSLSLSLSHTYKHTLSLTL